MIEQLGTGGCGVVYLAEQATPIRRRVALKIIRAGMDTERVIARFEAERHAMALMDHPHIAKVYDAGATDSGRPFFVMELVNGQRVSDYCEIHHLGLEQRLALFVQICHAVQHAHQKGVIHRDLKPSNILVTQVDGAPLPKIIDFGVAKAVSGRLGNASIVTMAEQLIGTPAYMSPEQALITCDDIDTRTDIYALGVLLYELLTGKPPFDSQELLTVGLDEMRRIIREVEPKRPSQLLITTRHLPLPSDLDWIVMKCLEKDRSRRYESANGLAADVQRYLNSEPVLARPPSHAYRIHKFVRRNRLQVGASTVALAALVFAAVFGTWQAWKAKRAEQAATEHAAIARRESEEAAKARDFLIESLFGGDIHGERRDTDALTVGATEALARKVARQLEGTFTNHPATEAQINYRLSRVFLTSRDFQSVARHAKRAMELWNRTLGPTHTNSIHALRELAHATYWNGRKDDAFALVTNSISLVQTSTNAVTHAAGCLMGTLGNLLSFEGRSQEAIRVLEDAIRILEQAMGRDHSTIKNWRSYLIIELEKIGDPRAEILWLELLSELKRDRGTDDLSAMGWELRYAERLVWKYRASDVVGTLEQLAERLPLKVPQTNSILLDCKFILANAYDQLGERTKASRLHTEVYPLREHFFPFPPAIQCNVTSAEFFAKNKEYEKAKSVFSGIRAALEKNPPNDPREFEVLLTATAATMGWTAAAELLQRNFESAPDSAYLWLVKAWLFRYVGDDYSFQEVVRRALPLAPGLALNDLHLPIETAALGLIPGEIRSDLEELAETLEAKLHLRGTNQPPWGWRALGHFRIQQERYEEALEALKNAETIQQAPDAYTLFLKAACQFHLGNVAAAADLFKSAVATSDRQLEQPLSTMERFLAPGQLFQHLVMRTEIAALLEQHSRSGPQ